MGYCKLNATQFAAATTNSLVGITLVYKRTDKETGADIESGMWFFGEEFTMKENTQEEMFRVWKNVIVASWMAKFAEKQGKADNGGIAIKLRATTPARIEFVMEGNKLAKSIDIENSVWARIGLIPSKKELEDNIRDFKKKLHKAAVASFNAMKFRVNFKEFAKPETYYDILHVAKNASAEDIKKAYKAAAAENHPDKGGNEERMKKVNEAWETLKDEAKRKEYDAKMAA